MKKFTGKFIKLQNEWRVIVNTGTPMVGDEIRVRKANGDVAVVFVTALKGTWEGKAVCLTTERKTVSAYSTIHLEGEINPKEMLSALRGAGVGSRRARIAEREDRRSKYEIDNQIGL
jgi:hypothetical protein